MDTYLCLKTKAYSILILILQHCMCDMQTIAAGAGALYLVSRVVYAKGYYTGGKNTTTLLYHITDSLSVCKNC